MKSPARTLSPSLLTLSVVLCAASTPAAVADEALAERAGCMNCHSVTDAGVGPAYRDIASRYSETATARALLSEKVATGGEGNWTKETGGASMPPYSNLLSSDEIMTLVDWILAQEVREE